MIICFHNYCFNLFWLVPTWIRMRPHSWQVSVPTPTPCCCALQGHFIQALSSTIMVWKLSCFMEWDSQSLNAFYGAKGIRVGRSGIIMLPRVDIGGLGWGSGYSPGVIDADYSLSSPKTVCAWLKSHSLREVALLCRTQRI